MKIVAIANQKGGVGKTTTAVNLGAALAELGHRILLVDLDPQANATSSFGLEGVEQISLYEPLLGEASITEKIFPTRRDGLFIVPADLIWPAPKWKSRACRIISPVWRRRSNLCMRTKRSISFSWIVRRRLEF